MTKLSTKTKERWKAIPSFAGYEASNLGRIRSIDRTVLRTHPTHGTEYLFIQKGKLLRPTDNGGGYKTVCLSIRGKVKRKTVHSLVLLAFVGPRPNGMETRHLDNDKGNNALYNICYGTGQENNYEDKHRHGTISLGEKHGISKLTEKKVRYIRKKFELGSKKFGFKALAQKYNVCSATIRDVVENRTWSHV